MRFRSSEMISRRLTISQEMWLIPIQDLSRIIRIPEAVSSRQALPCFCKCSSWWSDRSDAGRTLRSYPGCRRSIAFGRKDVNGPTAAANSVARLDHFIVSNGTLFNQKFHPSALAGREGLEKFTALIRSYFDQKGMHMQFNVVDRDTLLDAQKNPEKYKHLVVRVAGYSALFTTLSRSLQDDIIRRTEQGF